MGGKWRLVLLLTLVAAMLGGCVGEKPVLEEMGKDGKGKIKLVFDDEESFFRQYGDSFNVKYPDIEFEVVNLQELYWELQGKENVDHEAEWVKFLDKHKPDVLMIDLERMEKLVQEGKLYNLDAVIAQDKFDLEGYMPGLIDLLREQGGGSLYGLAPFFTTNVIYYNAGLFREHHIEPPRDKMSWQEVLELSNRFAGIGSGQDQIYGFDSSFGEPQELLFEVANVSSLRLFDAAGEKLVFQTDGWKQMVRLTTDAIRNKAVYALSLDEEDSGEDFSSIDEPFFQGKAAMIMGSPWFITQLRKRAVKDKEAKPIDWGMVTAPVDPASPDESSYASLYTVYAIAADSPNKRAAWEFVKFVNGPEMAKSISRTVSGELPTRNQFMKEIEGKSTEVFYALRPKGENESMWAGPNADILHPFYSEFRKILKKELKAVIANKKTVDEAVAAIQAEGEAVLRKIREEKKTRRLTTENGSQ
ncbi:MAG: extracellular solute-binding protein [Paenibacillus dendritiformis]|uniref:ABC transporter substrate-binding protein n=1 Tax=Paenibacillus dendritiformis TaxID=130049 RepID=UPI001AFD6627|nr:extracellular solute-binding protein [Paenibacillus dendritiformis]MDU5145716.1 extracellular solute-binding protein [Paenibacillus dendritiformis]GIO71958.1 hypothetical protein J27TS7_14720 [Paenibacillus dendritiformis]